MTFWNKVLVGLLAAGACVAGWQLRQHFRQGRELASIAAQIQTETQKLESRGAALTALEQRSRELAEAERRGGNQTLLALMRERARPPWPLRRPPPKRTVWAARWPRSSPAKNSGSRSGNTCATRCGPASGCSLVW